MRDVHFSGGFVAGDGFGNQLITWSLEVSGTGDILINYDGRNKAPGLKAFLVE